MLLGVSGFACVDVVVCSGFGIPAGVLLGAGAWYGLGVPMGVLLGALGFAWGVVGEFSFFGILVGVLLGAGGLDCAVSIIMFARGCGRMIVVLDVEGIGVYVELTDDVRCYCQKFLI